MLAGADAVTNFYQNWYKGLAAPIRTGKIQAKTHENIKVSLEIEMLVLDHSAEH